MLFQTTNNLSTSKGKALYRSIKWVDIIIQVVSVSYLIGYLYVYLS